MSISDTLLGLIAAASSAALTAARRSSSASVSALDGMVCARSSFEKSLLNEASEWSDTSSGFISSTCSGSSVWESMSKPLISS